MPSTTPRRHVHLVPSLQRDLQQLAALSGRRQALRVAGGLGLGGLLPLVGCGGGGADQAGSTDIASASTSTGSSGGTTTTSGSCSAIPSETAGPYPADGTNTASGGTSNALTLASIVRSDIRSSIDGASGTAAGVPVTVTLTLVNSSASCAVLSGYAVYLWHCDQQGRYSLYSSGAVDQNYLRGVQVSDANGQVSFTTIFPGCYSGRWPHMHFEIFRTLAQATSGNNDIRTSQLAMPAEACSAVYGSVSGYSASVANFAAISLASDNVFGNDSAVLQLPSISGSVSAGFAANLVVGVAA
ncbi:MAG: intradiol ring-cleavage dioxygenase [Burkholderiales bacterium PBB5]|nr:MAG: intradiol ring-cleavage dioxygenase [Burkholderiales bacterium PBB5]